MLFGLYQIVDAFIIRMTAYEEDEDKYLTATRIADIPENLTYICGTCEDS